MKLKLYFLILIVSLGSLDISSQIGIPTFEKGKQEYKDLLKAAKDQNGLILLILYSPSIKFDALPKIQYPDSILQQYNIVTDVADPFVEMYFLAQRLKSYRKPGLGIVNPDEFYGNPGWAIIHPDDFTISLSNTIKNDQELKKALDHAFQIKELYEEGKGALSEDKDNEEGLKNTISALTLSKEKKASKRYINRYLKNKTKWTDEEIIFMAEVARVTPSIGKLEAFVDKNRNRIRKLKSEDYLIGIDKQLIISKLKHRNLYEPYMIWKEFEKKFDTKADSLYRLEAINYFLYVALDIESLLTEIIDYLAFYPRTSWEILDPMYTSALKLISDKEDLLLMQDLIEGQIFQEKNYRKLDYKALILYRLGKKEQSLAMMSEIRKLSLEEGINYKSMIYTLRNK